MPGDGPLDFLPLWALFLLTLLFVLLAVEGGYRIGNRSRQRSDQEKEAPVGAMVGTTLGLLAFLLAFAFGMAADRFDARRGVLLEEANGIGTAYLRAELLGAPHGEEVRKLLREYVDVRLQAVRTGDIASAAKKSEALHTRLWAQAVDVGLKNPGSIVVGLFIDSLNNVIDLHTTRLQFGMRSRIPGTIWGALYLVAILAFAAMGYHGGLAGTSRSLAVVPVGLVFATALWLIANLDRPQAGWIEVNQQAMIDLRASMVPAQP